MPTKQHFERKSAAKPIFDEKGYPRGKMQNETGEAVEASVFVPWGALSTLSTRSVFFLEIHCFLTMLNVLKGTIF